MKKKDLATGSQNNQRLISNNPNSVNRNKQLYRLYPKSRFRLNEVLTSMEKELTPNNKRYAFVGNMNNMPYIYAGAIKRTERDVTIYIDAPPDYKLDRPESYDSTISYPYPGWIKEIPGNQMIHFCKLLLPNIFYAKLIKELNTYDTVILNGMWITLAPYLNQRVIVYSLCAGYEIDTLCDYRNIKTMAQASILHRRWLFPFKFLLHIFFWAKISKQRRGVSRSDGINYYPTGISPRGDELIREMMGEKKYRRLELRGFSESDFGYVEPQMNNNKFIILNFTRFFFLNQQLDNKRNDIMLKGIGSFLKKINFSDDVEILFFNKGDAESLRKAKEIIEKLNYSKYVKWFDEVSQKELFDEIVPKCDVVFDQLGNQWIGAGAFAMMMGRPLIANGRPEVFEPLTGEKSPVCQATTPEEVCFWLEKLYKDRDELKRIGLESRAYVRRHYDLRKTADFFLQDRLS